MGSRKTELEKKIQSLVEAVEKRVEERNLIIEENEKIANCLEGEMSAMKLMYNINAENSLWQWCFRSAKAEERRWAPEYIASENDSFDKVVDEILSDTCGALNNSKDYRTIRSFSKRLVVPLFKYYENSPSLAISKLPLNMVRAEIIVEPSHWILDSTESSLAYDDQKNIIDRFEKLSFEIYLPFTSLASETAVKKILWETLRGKMSHANFGGDKNDPFCFCDIDSIDVRVLGYCFDVSQAGRTELKNYYQTKSRASLKNIISFKADHEVLTTEAPDNYFTSDARVIEVIRFLCILRICKVSAKFDAILQDFICSLDDMKEHHDIIRLIDMYLTPETSRDELKAYGKQVINESINKFPPQPALLPTAENVSQLLDRLAEQDMFTDKVIFSEMRQLSGV